MGWLPVALWRWDWTGRDKVRERSILKKSAYTLWVLRSITLQNKNRHGPGPVPRAEGPGSGWPVQPMDTTHTVQRCRGSRRLGRPPVASI